MKNEMNYEDVMLNIKGTTVVEIVKAINNQIAEAYEEYNKYGRTQWYYRNISRVNGMIDVLKIITGGDYGFDENGLHVRKAV